MKTPDYMSYERYKNKKDSNPNKRMLIFITTFFVCLLLFTAVVKSLSPDVDVSIGDDTQTDAKETGLGVKKFIDDRLKMIQMEDNSAGVSVRSEDRNVPGYQDALKDEYSEPSEEKMNIPNKKDKKSSQDDSTLDNEYEVPTAPPRPSARELSNPFESIPTAQQPKMMKVLVGRYSTAEQARVAQDILMDSGLNITPFIRDMGNFYTLQVGSYSSRAKAESLMNDLQRSNFPARLVQE